MALSSDMWIDEHIDALGEYAAGNDNRDRAVERLKALGLDAEDIEDQLAECEEERTANINYVPINSNGDGKER